MALLNSVVQKPAVVLLSGGLDSATVFSVAKADGYACHALSFDYGQRHSIELECAEKLALEMGATRHETIAFDLRRFGGSALTADIDVPKGNVAEPESERGQSTRNADDAANGLQIPITYVPARNTIFLAFALAFAEVIGSSDIFIGVNSVDYSGYPDCRPEYIAAFERMANLGTRAAVEGRKLSIHTPLINLSKSEIIRLGAKNGVDYALTSSCYDPGPRGEPCTLCDSCHIRIKGFQDAGLRDPRL